MMVCKLCMMFVKIILFVSQALPSIKASLCLLISLAS